MEIKIKFIRNYKLKTITKHKKVFLIRIKIKEVMQNKLKALKNRNKIRLKLIRNF